MAITFSWRFDAELDLVSAARHDTFFEGCLEFYQRSEQIASAFTPKWQWPFQASQSWPPCNTILSPNMGLTNGSFEIYVEAPVAGPLCVSPG